MTVHEVTGTRGFDGVFNNKEYAWDRARRHALSEARVRESSYEGRHIVMHYLEDFDGRGTAETWGVFRLGRWRKGLELVCSFRVLSYEVE